MNTSINTREQISALADGELSDASIEAALLALRDAKSQEDWELIHHIGDALRSEELAVPLSTGFSARMAARLQAEVPHLPVASHPEPKSSDQESVPAAGGMLAAIRRYLLPGMAGTATLALAVLMAPQWMSATPHTSDNALATQTTVESFHAAILPPSASEHAPAKVHVAESQASVPEDDIVRDPLIDQYLMAHRRFSPAAYSSSQFVRSATFAAEADK